MIRLVLTVVLSLFIGVSAAAEAPGRHLERLILNNPELADQVSPKAYAVNENGTRSSSPESLCFTNPDVVSSAAHLAAEHFKANPNSEVYYLWIDRAECRCDNCQKLDSDSSHSGSYLHFVLKTASKIAPDYPTKKIAYVAVGAVSSPPTGAELPDNVVVMIPLKSGSIDSSDLHMVTLWKASTPDIAAHIEYPWNRLSPDYRPRRTAEELAALRRAGVSYCIIEMAHNALSEPQAYLASRMQQDLSARPEQVLDEYFTSKYEACAPAIKEFYRALQAAAVNQTAEGGGYEPDTAAIEKAWLSLKVAKQTAFGPPREHIEELQKEFILAYLPAKAYRLASSAGSRPVRGMADLAGSIADLQNALESAAAVERVYAAHQNAGGSNELQLWEEKMIPLLRSGAERIKRWMAANLAEEDAEIALTELTYRLLDNPWGDKAKLLEIR